jgi:hypothetical protein
MAVQGLTTSVARISLTKHFQGNSEFLDFSVIIEDTTSKVTKFLYLEAVFLVMCDPSMNEL